MQTFHNSDLKLKKSTHTKLLYNIDKTLFIILYTHYMPKISELKNQVPKLRFQI
jgi:hypothetical protein